MKVRLASEAAVDRWRTALADATQRAVDRMRVSVGRELASHGLSWESPQKDAPPGLWHDAEWHRAVRREIEPVARQVAAEIRVAVDAVIPADDLWGMTDPTEALVSLVVNRAAGLGPRFAAALGTRTVPALAGAGANLSALGDVLDRAADSLAEINGRAASQMVSGAQTAAAEALDANTDADVMQEWNTQGDDRVRYAHEDMEGQLRAAGEPFEDGDGNLLMYPGDPDAPDETTENCRCELFLAGYTSYSTGPGASQEAIGDAIDEALDAMDALGG